MIFYRRVIQNEYELGWAPLPRNEDFIENYVVEAGHCIREDEVAPTIPADYKVIAALTNAECKRECNKDDLCRGYEFQDGTSHWIKVRHIPADLTGWDLNNDKLLGTEVIGNSAVDSSAWAIAFNTGTFTHFRVESID